MNVFTKNDTLETMHLDRFGRAKPSALLYFVQEAATEHCGQLEMDWDSLQEKGLFWAVLRHRLQVARLPGLGESLRVETWPMPTTRSAFPRATAAYDEKGQLVFRCVSLWVLMDRKTRAMVLPGKSGVQLEGLVRGNELATPGSIVPKATPGQVERTVSYTDLDRNGHVNNTRYLDWVDDLLDSRFHQQHDLRELSVCYLAEATEGQRIQLSWELSEGPVLQVDAHRQRTDVNDGKQRVFSVMAEF